MHPLWLCLKITGGKERRAHQLLTARGVVSLYAHVIKERRVSRHAKRTVRYDLPLLTGYALVAHDGLPDFEHRLLRLEWPGSDLAVVRDILGRVPLADVARLEALSGKADTEPAPRPLSPGDIAILSALYDTEVRIIAVSGDKVQVQPVKKNSKDEYVDVGRPVKTTRDKLEAA